MLWHTFFLFYISFKKISHEISLIFVNPQAIPQAEIIVTFHPRPVTDIVLENNFVARITKVSTVFLIVHSTLKILYSFFLIYDFCL